MSEAARENDSYTVRKRKETRARNRRICLKLGITLKELHRRKAEQDMAVRQAKVDRKELDHIRRALEFIKERPLLPHAPSQFDIFCAKELAEIVRDILEWALFSADPQFGAFGLVKSWRSLSEQKRIRRQNLILCCRRGMLLPEFIGEPLSLKETARRFGITNQCAANHERRACRRLSEIFGSMQPGAVADALAAVLRLLPVPPWRVEKEPREGLAEQAWRQQNDEDSELAQEQARRERTRRLLRKQRQRQDETSIAARLGVGMPPGSLLVRLVVDRERELMEATPCVCPDERTLAGMERMSLGITKGPSYFSLSEGLRFGRGPVRISFSAVSPWGSADQWVGIVRRLFARVAYCACLEVVYKKIED